MNSSDVKKGAGVVSLMLGIVAWLGEKSSWFSQKVADALNFLSLGFGAVATFA
jgi:hypothetical protein